MQRFLLPISLLLSMSSFFIHQEAITHTLPEVELSTPSITGECRCTDSLNLINFYEGLNGPNWTEGWNFTIPMEEWNGIGLNEEGCVESITLNNNNLAGVLPEEIGDFSSLKRLSLGSNQLAGSLPTSINKLLLLESINFRSNELSGTIPADLAALKRLTTLNLSLNQLSGTIPSSVGNLAALTGLFLNGNNLTGPVPSFLENLDQLVSLNLASNELTGSIPSTLGLLTNLTGIGLNDNQLTGDLPLSLSFLSNLVSLRLENNQLTGSIPSEYGELTRIETIFLFNNNLSDCYPEPLTTFCHLGEGEFGRGYNFRNNSELPWQGNFSNFCDGIMQMGANCNTGVDSLLIEVIGEDCSCGEPVESVTETTPLFENIEVKGTCPNEATGQILWNNSSATTYTIEWTSPDNITTILPRQTNLFLPDLTNGVHVLTFINENNSDIIQNQQVAIPILSCSTQTQVPQAITPNGDGLNDRFIFEDLENNPAAFPDNELVIFNRWGDIVYTAKPYNNDWEGTNTTGNNVPEGTYYYVFKLDLNQGLIFKGSITIIR